MPGSSSDRVWTDAVGLFDVCRTKVLVTDVCGLAERLGHNFDIFERTEQIQQLVIARAISGLRIE